MITSVDIFKGIKNRILMMKDIEEEKILFESSFKSLEFDSLDYIETQVYVMSEYGVNIPEEKFSDLSISTIQELSEYVTSYNK
ncbi:phosphopantetheine-binding protein [Vibrio penaeicida]|uniref:phosphopantetheine-binding protein n=1 Tax=Vibrio penaeicida TaxID=104609 RepID=UPI000CEA6AF3|nr:phosphopantetheine-binding protein [Vibrio penaeicida]